MLRAISLFSGGGGLDLGMELAGFTPILATDHDGLCIQTLERNRQKHILIDGYGERSFLHSADIVQADIRKLDFTKTPLKGGEIDLVFGGPPCQAFSSAGRMGSIEDPRGQLVFEFARVVSEVLPRAFVMENVRGLVTARDTSGTPGGVLHALLETFERLGYSSHALLLNAADYGAYQRRVRCFVVGIRGGSPPSIPEPTHENTNVSNGLFCRQPWRTLSDFLLLHADTDEANWVRPTDALATQLTDVPDGSGLKSSGVVEATRPGGHWGYRQGTFIADQSLPARTVTGSSTQDWVRQPDGSLRRLTEKEAAMLQGFPPDWEFCGSKAQRFLQIGNAVPVSLGLTVGLSVVDALGSHMAGQPVAAWTIHQSLHTAIEYTKREERRNGSSRRARQVGPPQPVKTRGTR